MNIYRGITNNFLYYICAPLWKFIPTLKKIINVKSMYQLTQHSPKFMIHERNKITYVLLILAVTNIV